METKNISANAKFKVTLTVPKEIDVKVNIDKPFAGESGIVPRVLVLQEPVKKYWKYARNNYKDYDYLLTYFRDLLDIPNALYFYGVTPQVRPCPNINKVGSVSNITSGRFNNTGHRLRRELWKRKNEIKYPKNFWLSSQVPYNIDNEGYPTLEFGKWHKEKIMVSKYHIAIDTEDKYFNSEKLIDCFLTKTVPLYWGAKWYESEFDTSGIIHCEDVDNIIYKTNTLPMQSFYANNIKAIEFNYKIALKYKLYNDTLSRKITEIL